MQIAEIRERFPILEIYRAKLPSDEFQVLVSWLSTFFLFQLEWILDPSALALMNKSRQIGISHSTSAQVVLWSIYHGEINTVISIGQLESSEFLDKCKKHVAVLNKLGSQFARVKRDTATLLEFECGGKIFALPSSGGRSFSGNVIIDEFAYLPDVGAAIDAAMAASMHAGRKARIISTPNGVGDDFHYLVTNEDAHKGWSLHEVTIEDAIADGMDVDIEKCWAIAMGDPRLFAQMFKCEFLDGEEQYIPTEFIREAQKVDHRCPPGIAGQNYAGLDIGSTSNPTILWVLKKTKDSRRYTQYIEAVNPTTDDDIDRLISFAVDDIGCRKVCIDKTGLGEMPSKRQVERYPRIVEAIDFNTATKETMATGMYLVLSQKQIYIPPDKEILTEFSSIKRLTSKFGNVKYDAPQKGRAGHADRFWGCALANLAAGQANRLSGVTIGKQRHNARRER